MADKNAVFLTRHIGNTTYKVRVYLSETAEETMSACPVTMTSRVTRTPF